MSGPRLRTGPAARAFALPMVLVLVVVVGLMSAIMLERQSAQRLTVQRQLRWYSEHHARLGLQEAIEAWIKSLPSGLELGDALPASGHFLDLELPGGEVAVVTLVERQNAVLVDLAAVEKVLQDDAAAIVQACAAVFGEAGPPDGYRTVGPASLSTHTASPELLEVAAQAVTGDPGVARAFAASIVADRASNGGRSGPNAIGYAITDSSADPDLRAQLSRMFTVRPSLYYATVELRTSRTGGAQARYGGYFSVGNRAGSSDRTAFLTWENIGVE